MFLVCVQMRICSGRLAADSRLFVRHVPRPHKPPPHVGFPSQILIASFRWTRCGFSLGMCIFPITGHCLGMQRNPLPRGRDPTHFPRSRSAQHETNTGFTGKSRLCRGAKIIATVPSFAPPKTPASLHMSAPGMTRNSGVLGWPYS
jgi:hypothetical protein